LFYIFILVPDVLTSCAEFIEKFGIVDGIYRLSGVTSNIQRLRFVFFFNLSIQVWKYKFNIKTDVIDHYFNFLNKFVNYN